MTRVFVEMAIYSPAPRYDRAHCLVTSPFLNSRVLGSRLFSRSFEITNVKFPPSLYLQQQFGKIKEL